MPDTKRSKPYVWPTWITKLLSGEDKCWWKSWYRAHHKYDKREDPDRTRLDAWTKEHDEMVERRAARLRSKGRVVHVEEEAAFKIEGRDGILAGKPDIVSVDPATNDHDVIDAKSGKKRQADLWQLWIYLYALPRSWVQGAAVKIRAFVEYKDGLAPVPPLDDRRTKAIVDAVRLVTGPTEPKRVPSARECAWCDVAACPERVDKATQVHETKDF